MTALVALVAAGVLGAGGFAMLAAWSRAHPPAAPASAPSDRDVSVALAPCPASPNCVISLASDARHAIDPLRFAARPDEAWERLRAILLSLPGARVAAERSGYLRVEFRSRLFGFVDDAEFVLDAPAGRIDVRSASRVGWSDMGANRRRIEAITRLFGSRA